MAQVPYKGGAPMMQDLLANQINLGWDNLCTALPMIKSGRVRALAIAATQRAPELAEVPTFAELGYDNMDFGAWFGLSGPKSLSPELADTIAKHVAAVLDDERVKKRFSDAGIQIRKSKTPSDFAAYVDQDIARWRSVVERAKVKAET